MTICNFSCVFFKKRINISVALVSESYVLVYYENKVYMIFINTICLNQRCEFESRSDEVSDTTLYQKFVSYLLFPPIKLTATI